MDGSRLKVRFCPYFTDNLRPNEQYMSPETTLAPKKQCQGQHHHSYFPLLAIQSKIFAITETRESTVKEGGIEGKWREAPGYHRRFNGHSSNVDWNQRWNLIKPTQIRSVMTIWKSESQRNHNNWSATLLMCAIKELKIEWLAMKNCQSKRRWVNNWKLTSPVFLLFSENRNLENR